ncbi:type II toxin-antitoxin system ParD family antitoxin [Escherichia coli]|uniref:Antitoxin ParD n=2 Tax=Escherichia coli TaxID=562 RepID=A0A3W4JQ00_ECOLX|nr:type II toxin-antitoxin system ParD family antitoxin [Escherichia coli]EAB0915556.1 type II toxin-antitoxin system ParD family antitoxin [Escherichia coli]EEY5513104.1 type II toxin-antitoxin system ParD family antitoxin [Escherichia coli]EFC9518496.1 type II toxin-antitoxin system ParD family antitoxin [Escherichia coli]EFF2317191.1 type II toxin-antitoxin system ParD family antitoxin [Escherichia coli]
MHVKFKLTITRLDMARTMTVALGDELWEYIESLIESGDYRTQSEVIRESLRLLREKQAESRLQTLRNLLAEGLSSGEPVVWEKDAFLKKVKAGTKPAGEKR